MCHGVTTSQYFTLLLFDLIFCQIAQTASLSVAAAWNLSGLGLLA